MTPNEKFVRDGLVRRLAFEHNGVGWVATFRRVGDNRLLNAWVDDHTRGLLAGLAPIVLFDLWEHAYLLDFKPSQRKDYMGTLLDNVKWSVVEEHCK